MTAIEIKTLGPGDAGTLDRVAEEVFDHPVRSDLLAEFLEDARHHIVVALDESSLVVGMATAVHHVHPDKSNQLFINEVGVASSYQGQGIASKLLARLLSIGRERQCTEAWVATEPGNKAARALYERMGGQRTEEPFIMYTFPLDDGPGEQLRH